MKKLIPILVISIMVTTGCTSKPKISQHPLYMPPTSTELISEYKSLTYKDIYGDGGPGVSVAASMPDIVGGSSNVNNSKSVKQSASSASSADKSADKENKNKTQSTKTSQSSQKSGEATVIKKPAVIKDLWKEYQKRVYEPQIIQIKKDFNLVWSYYKDNDEKWPKDLDFDQKSTAPNQMVVLAKLSILKQQEFSEPLPFTSDELIYDYVKNRVNTFELRLDCGYSLSGGGDFSLNRQFSLWDWRDDITGDKFLTCREVEWSKLKLAPYIYFLHDLVHKARHNERGAPGHKECGSEKYADENLENGSGNAYAAMYLMWVYKYSYHDPVYIKNEAKKIATLILAEKFCKPPKHSNPKVQAIVDELLK